MEVPSYIARLHQASGNGKARDRRAWGIEVGSVWIPYFTAANAAGVSEVSSETLGVPLRLRLRDGAVQFGKDGRPSLSVAKELSGQIAQVKANFEAELLHFVNMVQQEDPTAYKAQVEAAQQAGEPILADMSRQIAEAILACQPKTEAPSEGTPLPPQDLPTPQEEAAPGNKRRQREQVAA